MEVRIKEHKYTKYPRRIKNAHHNIRKYTYITNDYSIIQEYEVCSTHFIQNLMYHIDIMNFL